MEKRLRMGLLLSADVIIINVSFIASMFLTGNGHLDSNLLAVFLRISMLTTIVKLLIYQKFSLYNSVWEHASIEELMKVVGAVLVANVVSIAYMTYANFSVFAGVYVIAVMLEICGVGGVRFSYRLMRRVKQKKTFGRGGEKNVLIVGCGSTANLIAAQMKNHAELHGQVMGYIDEGATHSIGANIAGVKVLGNKNDIFSVSKRFSISEIILAVPTASKDDRREMLEECKRTNAKVRIVPGIREIMDGKVSLNKIRDVEIEDLLGRDSINLNVGEIEDYIDGKVVLVTGGGGSIGSELCRQIAQFNPKKLIILDIYENNAYNLQIELEHEYGNRLNLDVIIASVRDRENIYEIFAEHKPQVVFHAAAHKHVPLMERVPREAIKNNVFGTLNVAEAAKANGVERFVLISTDKAVNPTNIMGASKRVCEMIIQSLARESKTKFVAVRFGNVLGSNGSVIPLFKKQIEEGGPVTVTHKDIIRYFMTIPEASQLVIQACAMARGGEVFVLDMGEPVRIYDLAVDLIQLSGLVPHDEIEVKVTGLRPGEKLYEELLMAEEGLLETQYKKIFIGSPSEIDFKLLKRNLDKIKKDIYSTSDISMKEMVKVLVPSYTYKQKIQGECIDQEEAEMEEDEEGADGANSDRKDKNHAGRLQGNYPAEIAEYVQA